MTIFGWLVTAIGWLVANFQANHRERRKEIRAEVDRLISTLDGLLEAAREYYTSNGNNREEPRLRIHTLINRSSSQIEFLETRKNGPEMNIRMAALFEAITDGNFESKKLKPQPLSGERYVRIAAATENLSSTVERWFRSSSF